MMSGALEMNHAAFMSYIHSHVLGISLIATGVTVHAAQPYVENSLACVASSPSVLNLRASYYLAVGDVDCARILAQRAAQPCVKRT
jgi:hypothetical protein